MPSFFLSLIAVLLTSMGSRDQLLVAQLSASLGRNIGLLVTGWLSAIAAAAAMAWAGQAAAQILPPEGKTMLVAIAMLLAGVELAWPNRGKPVKEPTRSLFAVALVLFSRQLGDAAGFLVFALAAATGSSLLAGVGGALGGGIAVTIGWMAGRELSARRALLRMLRVALAAIVLLAGVIIGLSARGLIG